MNFHNVAFLASYGTSKQLPACKDKIEIAFAGRSNVGKSSMINKIFNRKNLARVSAVPGKTTTINFFGLENVIFADLPGYGFAKVSKSEKLRWSDLIEGYFHQDRNLALVMQLIDMRHAPTSDDLMMIDFLIESEIPFIIVLTKKDKLKKSQQQKRLEELKTEIPYGDQITMIPFSSLNGEGADDIKAIIEDLASDDSFLEGSEEQDEIEAENE